MLVCVSEGSEKPTSLGMEFVMFVSIISHIILSRGFTIDDVATRNAHTSQILRVGAGGNIQKVVP